MKIKVAGFSAGAYGNLGDAIYILVADGEDVLLHVGEEIEVIRELETQRCPACERELLPDGSCPNDDPTCGPEFHAEMILQANAKCPYCHMLFFRNRKS